MANIEIQNLQKYYGKNLVLDIPSINFQSGNSIGVFGANGSGKSTFIKCLTGLVPFNGKITIDNKDISKEPSIMTNVGLLIEEPALYKDLTGRKNIEYFCKDTSKLTEYAKILDVSDILDRKVRSYSLGMCQKIAILLACIKGKNLILLDEPFNCLDIISVEKVIDLMNLCKKNGSTIIFTSHQLEISQKALDIYYLLKNNQIYDCTAHHIVGGKKFIIEFFNKKSAYLAYTLLKENNYECVLDDFYIKILNNTNIQKIVNILDELDIKKIEDISYSIKESYLEMENIK